jgi:hypothetical protein
LVAETTLVETEEDSGWIEEDKELRRDDIVEVALSGVLRKELESGRLRELRRDDIGALEAVSDSAETTEVDGASADIELAWVSVNEE